MSTFGITDDGQLIDAVNYLLVNLGQNTGNSTGNVGNAVTINTTTGQVNQNGILLSYFYQYLYVRYATNSTGTTGFSTSPTNATYYGVLNNANGSTLSPTVLNNPANYQWTQVAGGGFGTTKFLWYSTLGGQQIQFYVGPTTLNSNYALTPTTTPINLQFVTATSTLPLVVMTAYQRANSLPATPTGGTYNFSTLEFLAPTSPTVWSNSIPVGNSAFYSTQNTFQADPTGNVVVGPIGPWTTAVLTGQNGANGTNGANGANGANGTNGANGISTYLYNVFQSAASTPATPTGGSYTFSTATGVPPTGWLNYPSSSGNNSVYVSTTSVSTTTPTVPVTSLTWSSPTQYTGGNGTPGPRGFIPMGYVLTPSTPVGASNSNLSFWFQSPTNGTPAGSNAAPVGTGFVPVDGDTASFTYSANTAVNIVYTYNSANSSWTPANGQVINGNVFVTGSVNANKLAANDIYTLKLQSTNATFGSPTGFGFWLDAATGNAYMANTVTIGNQLRVGNNANIGTNLIVGANATIGTNLIVGANAQIGGNLTIGGLTTNGTLNPNVVTNTAIASGVDGGKLQSGTVTAAQIAAGTITATQISASYVYAGNIISTNAANSFPSINSPGYWLRYDTGDARFGGNVNIGNNLTVGNLITTSTLNANTVSFENLQSGLLASSPGSVIIAQSPHSIAGSSGWSEITANWYDFVMAYVTIPYSPAYSVAGAANPRFTINFNGNFAFTMGTAGVSFPYIQAYVKTLVPSGGSVAPGATYTSVGTAQYLTGTTSFNGRIWYAPGTITVPVASWSPTTSVVIGIALFGSLNPTYAITGTLSNMTFSASNA